MERWTDYYEGLQIQKIRAPRLFVDAFEFLTEYNKATLLLFIPITTFLTWILFRKQRYNLAEHLIYNTIIMSGEAMVYAFIFMPAFGIVEHSFKANNNIIQFVVVVYRIVGNRQVFKEKWILVILKTILMKFLQILLIWLLVMAGIFIYRNLLTLIAPETH